jgi:hypothetical protein
MQAVCLESESRHRHPGRERPKLALFGPDRPSRRRLFLRVKRTSGLRAPKSENDPTRTGGATFCCCAQSRPIREVLYFPRPRSARFAAA